MPRILLVDDQAEVRDTLSLMLSGAGHTVVAVNSVDLEQIAGRTFDLLITDMVMPKINGLEVIRHIQKTQPHINVITISGAPWDNEFWPLDVAMGLGAHRVIAKPFRRAAFLALVYDCLHHAEGGAAAAPRRGRPDGAI